jgi:hypothetical protein
VFGVQLSPVHTVEGVEVDLGQTDKGNGEQTMDLGFEIGVGVNKVKADGRGDNAR